MSTKLQRLNSLDYQIVQIQIQYNDVLADSIGLAMQLHNFINSIEMLIFEEEKKG
jgi:hypothetical protein